MNLELLIRIGGLLHFCILLASAIAPSAARWRMDLASLPPLLRQMFWVYAGFIVLVIIGFGTLSLSFTPAIAAGEPVGRALSAFIGLFWLTRLGVQCFVFDVRPYLTHWFFTVGYHGLTIVFTYLAAVFMWAALAR
jgi:hypothetical protein